MNVKKTLMEAEFPPMCYRMDGTPYPPGERGLREIAKDFEDFGRRQVAETFLDEGRIRISTVWLGLDHSFGGGPPLIFETMVFPGTEDLDRYSSREEALRGHEAIVKKWRRKLLTSSKAAVVVSARRPRKAPPLGRKAPK